MNNNYGFSYYLDNMDNIGRYNLECILDEDKNNQNTKPRNEKIDKLITKENLDQNLFDNKIKGKNLIIIYKYNIERKVLIFTQKEN